MRISIAMCTYNGSRFLQKQLDSFESQTQPPYELIVCDDGSGDDTLALLESFAEKVTFRVRIFKNQRNLGSTKNFEKAIGLCDGELIALSDQDDEWYPDKLARMHRLFEELPEALAAFSDADIIDERSALTGRKLWRSVYFSPTKKVPYVDTEIVSTLLRLDYIATGATMVFRSELRKQFVPIPDLWVHDAWIAWMAAVRGGLAPLSAATIGYRLHARQQIGLMPRSIVEQVAVVRKNVVFFRVVAKRLKGLRLYLEQHKNDDGLAKVVPDVDAKIRHLEGRASLAGSVYNRVGWILRSWREYERYARGPISMISDGFIVSLEEAAGDDRREHIAAIESGDYKSSSNPAVLKRDVKNK